MATTQMISGYSVAPQVEVSEESQAMNKAMTGVKSVEEQVKEVEQVKVNFQDQLKQEKSTLEYPFKKGTEVDMGELEAWVGANQDFPDREYYYHALDVLNQDAADADRANGYLQAGDSSIQYGSLVSDVDVAEGRLADIEYAMSQAKDEEEYAVAVEQREEVYKELTRAKSMVHDYGFQGHGDIRDTLGAAVGGIINGTLNPIDSIKGVIRQEVVRNNIDPRDTEVAETIQNWGGGLGAVSAGVDAISTLVSSVTGGTSKAVTDTVKATLLGSLVKGITKGVVKGAAVGSAGGASIEGGVLLAGTQAGVDYTAQEAVERVGKAGAMGGVVGSVLGGGMEGTKVVGGKVADVGKEYAGGIATGATFAAGGGLLSPLAGSATKVVKDAITGEGQTGSIVDSLLKRSDMTPEGKAAIADVVKASQGDAALADLSLLQAFTKPDSVTPEVSVFMQTDGYSLVGKDVEKALGKYMGSGVLDAAGREAQTQSVIKEIAKENIKRSAVEGLAGEGTPWGRWVKGKLLSETEGSRTQAAITSRLISNNVLGLDNPQSTILNATNVFTRRFLSDDLSKLISGTQQFGNSLNFSLGNSFLVQNSSTLEEFENEVESGVSKYQTQENLIKGVLNSVNNGVGFNFDNYGSDSLKVALMADVGSTLKNSNKTVTKNQLVELYNPVSNILSDINTKVRDGKTIKEPTAMQRELHEDDPIPYVTAYDFAKEMGLIQ